MAVIIKISLIIYVMSILERISAINFQDFFHIIFSLTFWQKLHTFISFYSRLFNFNFM